MSLILNNAQKLNNNNNKNAAAKRAPNASKRKDDAQEDEGAAMNDVREGIKSDPERCPVQDRHILQYMWYFSTPYPHILFPFLVTMQLHCSSSTVPRRTLRV
jgi:hypothetical protein